MDDLLELRTLLVQRGLPSDAHRLIWRTTSMGHPRCNTYNAPLSSVHQAAEALLGCEVCVEQWGWHTFPMYDRAASELLGAIGAHVLDIRPMSALRPDAHSAKLFRGQPDCLHYALPGVPDWWGALLLSTMDACGL